MLLGRLIGLYRDCVLEGLFNELLLARGQWHADGLAFKGCLDVLENRFPRSLVIRGHGLSGFRELGEGRGFENAKGIRGARVRRREIHNLAPLRVRPHGQDGVKLAGEQGRHLAVPVLRHDLALEIGPFADLIGDIDVIADDLAVSRCRIVGRKGPFHTDGDLRPFLRCSRLPEQRYQRKDRRRDLDDLQILH
jgi:hypothetical protein